ncbi:hypothetical protein ACS0TY_032233 [Phlomoides rotata]
MTVASSSPKDKMSFTCFILIILVFSQTKHALACFESIISFGDSLADTGNLLQLYPPSNKPPYFSLPPYGETFFHHPTGRFSDGRIIIDFFAQDLRLPMVEPFYGGTNLSNGGFGGGVNFAVGGATALPDSFFAEKGVKIPYTNVSLMAQLSWFKQIFLPTICHNPADCKKYVETSLVLMGEIGGNDYNNAFFSGKSVDVVRSFIPEVVKAIGLSITELIKLGAVTIMVPGNLPIGCSASYLTFFQNPNKTEYDPQTGCLNWLNTFSEYHNKLLQSELHRIRLHNPNITIIYADYYNAAIQLYRSPQKYGFGRGGLRACCGGGGPYNVNTRVQCGYEGSEVCEDPSSYVSWDGVHLTEAAYRWISRGSFTVPKLSSVCAPHVSSNDVIGLENN